MGNLGVWILQKYPTYSGSKKALNGVGSGPVLSDSRMAQMSHKMPGQTSDPFLIREPL